MNGLKKLHFIGIGGSGMSTLARVMLERGYTVSGSDLADKPVLTELKRLGATIYIGHDPAHLQGADAVIYTSDIHTENVEWIAAKKANLSLMHRSDLLATLLNGGRGIAVSGSHGKTTTTSMISFLLERAGLDPTYVIGGEMVGGGGAHAGRSELVVAEADESDRTFLKYRPFIGVITNIEPDHLENYDEDYGKMKEAFLQFATQVKPGGRIVLGIDDPDIREILDRITGEVITFGVEEKGADYRATEISSEGGLSFTAIERGRELGRVHLSLSGRHNIYNALAALAVVRFLDVDFVQAAEILKDFKGAKRRFQRIGEHSGIEVIDDYAVHPTEIRTVLRTAREKGRRVVAVFQPHRQARVNYLLEQFGEAFRDADRVYITEIYSPRGDHQYQGINAAMLADEIRRRSGVEVHFIPNQEDLLITLLQEVKPGDLVITLGAGDINKVGYRLVEELQGGKQS